MEDKKVVRVASACSDEKCCPVADLDRSTGKVTIYDPEKPERGAFVLESDEWRIFAASIRNI